MITFVRLAARPLTMGRHLYQNGDLHKAVDLLDTLSI